MTYDVIWLYTAYYEKKTILTINYLLNTTFASINS